MENIFTTTSTCHPEFISGSDPSAQGARCRNKSGMTWDRGFTLAEILITLGIIGVVASLTMPGLINNYQNRVYETANLVFENRLGEALRQMNIAEDLTGYTESRKTQKISENHQGMRVSQRASMLCRQNRHRRRFD